MDTTFKTGGYCSHCLHIKSECTCLYEQMKLMREVFDKKEEPITPSNMEELFRNFIRENHLTQKWESYLKRNNISNIIEISNEVFKGSQQLDEMFTEALNMSIKKSGKKKTNLKNRL